jgi:hypothetical protein
MHAIFTRVQKTETQRHAKGVWKSGTKFTVQRITALVNKVFHDLQFGMLSATECFGRLPANVPETRVRLAVLKVAAFSDDIDHQTVVCVKRTVCRREAPHAIARDCLTSLKVAALAENVFHSLLVTVGCAIEKSLGPFQSIAGPDAAVWCFALFV